MNERKEMGSPQRHKFPELGVLLMHVVLLHRARNSDIRIIEKSNLLLYSKRLKKRSIIQNKHTSTESALHVESPWILFEVFRPGFFRPVVQLANILTNDKIVALASDILAA